MPYSDQVDAEPVRRHLRELLDGGMTVVQIQNLSGVNRTAIRVILGEFPNRKPSVQVRAETASRILRTRLDPSSAIEGLVPAVGTVRRLQALHAIGWTKRALADRLGYAGRQLQIARTSEWVSAANAERVRELYAELSDRTPSPSRAVTASRTRAAAAGWLPPIWWDDDTLDDPSANPAADVHEANELDEVAVARLMSGTLRVAKWSRARELNESIRRLAARGLNDRQIAELIGMKPHAVTARRLHNDIPAGQQIDVIAAGVTTSEDVTPAPTRRAISA